MCLLANINYFYMCTSLIKNKHILFPNINVIRAHYIILFLHERLLKMNVFISILGAQLFPYNVSQYELSDLNINTLMYIHNHIDDTQKQIIKLWGLFPLS